MKSPAEQFIESIASDITEARKPLNAILATLEDGEALAYLGATDDDQELIEGSHALVSQWIESGLTTLDQVEVAQ